MTDDPIEFTVFDVNTREPLRLMRASDIHLVDLQCGPDEGWVFGHWPADAYRIDEDAQPVPIEPSEG